MNLLVALGLIAAALIALVGLAEEIGRRLRERSAAYPPVEE